IPAPKKLGKDANIAAAPSKSDKFRNYKLLSFAQAILIKNDIKAANSENAHRTRLCHAVRNRNADSITLNISRENSPLRTASLGGVQTCGSVWSCPVCARRIAVQRGDEIKQALA